MRSCYLHLSLHFYEIVVLLFVGIPDFPFFFAFSNSLYYQLYTHWNMLKMLVLCVMNRGFAILHKSLSFFAGVCFAGIGYLSLSNQLVFRVNLNFFNDA